MVLLQTTPHGVIETMYSKNVLKNDQTLQPCTRVNVFLYDHPSLYLINQITIQPQTICPTQSNNSLNVTVTYKSGCPPGFNIAGISSQAKCNCISLLQKNSVSYDLDKETIKLEGQEWIGIYQYLDHSMM